MRIDCWPHCVHRQEGNTRAQRSSAVCLSRLSNSAGVRKTGGKSKTRSKHCKQEHYDSFVSYRNDQGNGQGGGGSSLGWCSRWSRRYCCCRLSKVRLLILFLHGLISAHFSRRLDQRSSTRLERCSPSKQQSTCVTKHPDGKLNSTRDKGRVPPWS